MEIKKRFKILSSLDTNFKEKKTIFYLINKNFKLFLEDIEVIFRRHLLLLTDKFKRDKIIIWVFAFFKNYWLKITAVCFSWRLNFVFCFF